ncbi:Vacuolar protein sorting-associated protein [Trema orientale]|uniref:Vacuolar protein sorting-associated protein n=1 Tax=Trema orientale TaxID=63057 RepID=A0A2P5FAD4_TREOI|nr:Vacuolar protein sorting-associated protein [Trema orientale]
MVASAKNIVRIPSTKEAIKSFDLEFKSFNSQVSSTEFDTHSLTQVLSTHKQLLKQAQFRLKVLKKRRHSMVRQSSEILAQLIKNDEENIDFNRAKQLFKDESIEEAYELLDHFCEFILVQFSHIRKLEDCRDDVNEAVSILIYASTRCGEVPELRVIRKLFEKRYGQKFAKAAIELFPGNRVNQQVVYCDT